MTRYSETAGPLYVDALLEQLGIRSDKPVLRYLHTDVTGGALRRSIFRYARALEALGIGRGCLVALLAPNCPDALAIRYAANLLGAATLFTPALANVDHQKALLARVRPTLLVVFAETVDLIPDGVTARIALVGFGADSLRLDRLAAAHPDQPLHSRAMPDDLAVIVSSGGTTGVPKCSRRSFAGYSAMVRAERAEGKRQLVNGALAYISQVLVDSTLMSGGTVVLDCHYDAAATLSMIESERITDLLLVEPQLFEMMDHPDARWRDLSSLRSIAHIGGSAPAVLRQRAIKRFRPGAQAYVWRERGGSGERACATRIRGERQSAIQRGTHDGWRRGTHSPRERIARGCRGNRQHRGEVAFGGAGLLQAAGSGVTQVSQRLVPDGRHRLHRRRRQLACSRAGVRCRCGRWRAYQPDDDRGNSLLAARRALCRSVCTGKNFSGIHVECAG